MIVLAIDHRVDVCRELLGVEAAEPAAAEREQAAQLKQIVFEGMAKAIESGVAKSHAVIWADRDLGEAVLLRARHMALRTAFSAEAAASDTFKLDDEAGIEAAASRFGAKLVAARVPFITGVSRQARDAKDGALRILSETCRAANLDLLIEPVVLPSEDGLAGAADMREWNAKARPLLTIEAMRELQDAGVEPRVWVVEPPSDARAAAAVVGQAYVDDRTAASVLFAVSNDPGVMRPGSVPGAAERTVARRAARSVGVNGLLIGPGAYFHRLALHNSGEIDREAAVDSIAGHVRELYEVFTEARRTSDVA